MRIKFGFRKTVSDFFKRTARWIKVMWGWFRSQLSQIHLPRVSLKGFFNAIAQFGTLAATIIALYALRETRLQRESMYKPILFIRTSDLYVKRGEMNYLQYFEERDDTLVQIYKPYFRIDNVGMGCAFSVITNIFYDSSTLSTILSNRGIKDILIKEKYPISEVVVNHKDTITCFSDDFVRTTKTDMTDFVLPINQSAEESVQFFMPWIIEMIMDTYHCIGEPYLAITIPICMRYKDINGKTYKRYLDMDFSFAPEKDDIIRLRIFPGLSYSDQLKVYSPISREIE